MMHGQQNIDFFIVKASGDDSWFQASVADSMGTALLWVVVISYLYVVPKYQ
jgi:hypothetical protein